MDAFGKGGWVGGGMAQQKFRKRGEVAKWVR